jgi:hypothetical protein
MALRNRDAEFRAERRAELIENTLAVVVGSLVVIAGMYGLIE